MKVPAAMLNFEGINDIPAGLKKATLASLVWALVCAIAACLAP